MKKAVDPFKFVRTWLRVRKVSRDPKAIFFIRPRWYPDGLFLSITLGGRTYVLDFRSRGNSDQV